MWGGFDARQKGPMYLGVFVKADTFKNVFHETQFFFLASIFEMFLNS